MVLPIGCLSGLHHHPQSAMSRKGTVTMISVVEDTRTQVPQAEDCDLLTARGYLNPIAVGSVLRHSCKLKIDTNRIKLSPASSVLLSHHRP